jgi:mRNA interferase MazF
VWLVDLEPVKGHEQGRVRPALIISADKMNQGTSELVVVVPMTTTKPPRHLEKMRVTVAPPEAKLPQTSYAMPEHVRSVTTDRILKHYGKVSPKSLASVEDLLRVVLNL